MFQIIKRLTIDSRLTALCAQSGRCPSVQWIRCNARPAQTGPDLKHFIANSEPKPFVVKREASLPYVSDEDLDGNGSTGSVNYENDIILLFIEFV